MVSGMSKRDKETPVGKLIKMLGDKLRFGFPMH